MNKDQREDYKADKHFKDVTAVITKIFTEGTGEFLLKQMSTNNTVSKLLYIMKKHFPLLMPM